MLKTRHQLEIVALIAIACLVVGSTIGWTWYLQAVYWAALLGFCVLTGLSRWECKRRQPEGTGRPPRDFIREQNGPWPTMQGSVRDDQTAPSVAVFPTLTESQGTALHQFQMRRMVVHVLVSVLIFGVLVVLGHMNPFLALAATLAGGLIALVLQLFT